MWLAWLALGLIVGFLVGKKILQENFSQRLRELARLVSYHRSGYLKVLQRELANILIQHDPIRLVSTYQRAHGESETFKTADRSVLEAKCLLLTKQYPQYESFDLISTRDYVLYSDATDINTFEEIEQRYCDILVFQALQDKLAGNWPAFATTSEKELKHLKEYAQEVVDSKFEHKLKQAMSEFRNFESLVPDEDEHPSFETPEFSVRHVEHYAENRYGIHLKSTDEFGLYGFFVHDDGRISEQYYRSDDTFEIEKVLRT